MSSCRNINCSGRVKLISLLLIQIITNTPLAANAQQILMTNGSYVIANGNVSIVAYNSSLNNNGTFIPGNSTVVFAGYTDTTASYVTGTSTTTLNNITVDKHGYGVALKSAVNVTNILTMTTGKMFTDDNLTLISSAANTARVASVPVSCTISGKAYVQRYIPAHRAWRLLTAPVTSSNTIYNAWQNGGAYTPGIGTLITKPNPTAGDGMDVGVNTNYSMKYFNMATQGLVNVSNTMTSKISTGTNGSADNTGYFIFIRSDRNPASIGNPYFSALPCVNTTLSSFGKLQIGNQAFTASSSALKLTLVGNPYASPIDFNNVTRSNIIKRFYVWDAKLNQVGGFVVLDDIFNTGTYTKSPAGSSQTNEIQSGQAFFVQTLSAGAASLTVTESSKSTTNNNLVFRPALGMASINVNLNLLDANSTTFADGALEQFSEVFDTAVDWQDASKLGNINEGIGILRNGKNLAIERRPGLSIKDTLFLNLTTTTPRAYQFEFNADNLQASGLVGILVDKYLGTTTPVSLSGTTKVNFSVVSGVPASTGSARFMIIFKMLGVTPVTFTNVNAYQLNSGIVIDWKVENERNMEQYEIERSDDGKNFTEVNSLIAKGNNNTSADYNWLDAKPFSGYNYYRIKSVEKNGTVKYSEVIRVTTNNIGDDISVYPNPVTNNVINIQFNKQPLGRYMLHLINDAGQVVYEKEISVNSNNSSQALSLQPSFAKGIYQLKLNGPGDKKTVQKISIR